MTQNNSPELDGQFLDAIRAVAGEYSVRVNPEELGAASRDLEIRMRAVGKISDTASVGTGVSPFKPAIHWLAVAGAMFVIAIAGIKFAQKFQATPAVPSTQFKEYATAPGQRATINLKDGTQVLLNVASRLRVGQRVIDLSGEAQFVVKHDPKRPFAVRANGTIVRDLATTFVVKAYPGVSSTHVAVRDGRVSVQAPAIVASDAIAVSAGKAAVIGSDSKISVSTLNDLDRYFGWTRGRLVLNKIPLPEALVELGRWYGLDFRVADSSMLAIDDVSGAFPETLTAERLRAIADIIGARAQRTGTTVVFHPINP